MASRETLLKILDLARWAPSGDNTQPWRFEIVDAQSLVVHGFDTREHCVYDLDGRPSQISLGALLETMAIAATAHGLQMHTSRRTDCLETKPTFEVRFAPDSAIQPSPLIEAITRRSVQRRPMSTRPLSAQHKAALEAAVGGGFSLRWFEGWRSRMHIARLMSRNAKLRLTMPEAYQVHRDIIQWNARFSEDRVPDQALGVDPMTARLMQCVMRSWQRVEFFNTYLAGTLVPRIQMDLIPGLLCAAHLVIKARRKPTGIDDFVAAGRAVQRLWLTATQLGLVQQPEMTPLIFSSYVRNQTPFTSVAGLQLQARALEAATRSLIGPDADHAVWMGRVGAGPVPSSRSTRRPLQALMHNEPPLAGHGEARS